MGMIKEPKGIDFIIQTEKWTEKDRLEISKFIADYKAESKIKSFKKIRRRTTRKGTTAQ